MSKRKPLETEEELEEALDKLFDEIPPPETPEEVDETLREAGYDPEAIAAQMKAFAEQALANSPLNWRNRAPQEIEAGRSRLAEFLSNTPKNRDDLVQAIRQQLSQLGGQAAYAHRNLELETASDEDLAGWLADLQYLASQQDTPDEENGGRA